jgi:hypothetical protein
MNVLLDSHAIRPFSHAIACLTKIGKDVVIEATPSSLTLRTLNDSQSAYITVTFRKDFFIECNSYDLSVSGSWRFRKRRRTGGSSSSAAAASGAFEDEETEDATDQSDNDGDGDGYSFSSGRPKDSSFKFLCKTSLKAVHGILKRSRHVHTLRISSSSSSYQPASQILTSTQSSDPPGPHPTAATQLVFEFSCPLGVRKIHRIGLQAAEHDWIVEDPKVAQECSTLSCNADALIDLLDPVAKSAELVLTFTETECKAQSFDQFTRGSKDLASATAPTAPTTNSLKTETSMAVEDFQQYDFQTNRDALGGGRLKGFSSKVGGGGGADSTEGADGSSSASKSSNDAGASSMPSDVNEKVSLVFTTKELKALMVFCQGVSKPVEDDETYRPVKPLVECSFSWGGRPIIFKCTDLDEEGEGGKWEVMLILASRDWALLEPERGEV